MRNCEWCGKSYERRRWSNGKLECLAKFTASRFCSQECHNRSNGAQVKPGPDHHSWIGDAVSTKSGRDRAQRIYPMANCELCHRPGKDRHHRDGNTANNEPRNIQHLCRRCHMQVDGRLQKLLEAADRVREVPRPARPCVVCSRPYKPLRKGRCTSCYFYLRKHGIERPITQNAQATAK